MQGTHNAFHVCAVGGHLAVAEYLVPKMEAHLFDSDNAGCTALHWAAQVGQLSMVEYLVQSCEFDMKAVDMVGLHCLLLNFLVSFVTPLDTPVCCIDTRDMHTCA